MAFSSTYQSEKLVLLEIPKGMESVFERNDDENLCFKGNENNVGMVMCTSEKTFCVRRVESSNTTLFAPRTVSGKSITVESGASCYYELIPTHPRTKVLWSMLSKSPFCFVEKSSENEKRPTMKKISVVLQASDKEIRSELRRLKAIEFEDRWSIVDEACLDEAFNHLVREMDANQWSGKDFPRSKWVSSFSTSSSSDDESSRMRELVANVLCERLVDENRMENVTLNFCSLAKHRASQILRELPQKEWSEEEFFCEWQSRLPDFEGEEPSMSWLEGMILLSSIDDGEKKMVVDDEDEDVEMKEESNETVFKMFPLRPHEIASDAGERFDQLFSIRPSWSMESLRPFMKDLLLKSSTEDDLLMKFTRSFKAADGTQMHSRK